jgi:D-arabinose 1-dehydrogenase-like Zn-dependent alcohol dehydrogenase
VTAGKISLKLGLVIINGLEIIGTDSCTAAELTQTFAFLDATGLRPSIDHILPLEDAARAHEMIQASQVQGRVVLKIGADW